MVITFGSLLLRDAALAASAASIAAAEAAAEADEDSDNNGSDDHAHDHADQVSCSAFLSSAANSIDSAAIGASFVLLDNNVAVVAGIVAVARV